MTQNTVMPRDLESARAAVARASRGCDGLRLLILCLDTLTGGLPENEYTTEVEALRTTRERLGSRVADDLRHAEVMLSDDLTF